MKVEMAHDSSHARLLERVRTLDLKQMDAVLLAVEIQSRAAAAGMEAIRIDHAIATAAWAHRRQRRLVRGDLPSTTYIEHPLRNAARVLRWGVVSEPIVVACILHDTVEDSSFELAEVFGGEPVEDEGVARETVLIQFEDVFGERVAELVRALSNPLTGERRAEGDAHRAYRDHVLEAIADPQVAVCKLADLVDNALSLHHTGSPDDPRTARLARKYAPVLEAVRERIAAQDVRDLLSADGHRAVTEALAAGMRVQAAPAG
jgi:(p)ppGpp synthase/HD superfamily hydrolase